MQRVAELVGAIPREGDEPDLAPMPATRLSRRIATSTGADRHVAIRSLAEQLVCEANAVLTTGDDLTLSDEALPSELAFTIGYRGRGARVSTTFAEGTAYGRLVGDGFETDAPTELEDADALPDLVVRLLVGSGATHNSVIA
jgi:hypothetical protein